MAGEFTEFIKLISSRSVFKFRSWHPLPNCLSPARSRRCARSYMFRSLAWNPFHQAFSLFGIGRKRLEEVSSPSLNSSGGLVQEGVGVTSGDGSLGLGLAA